MYLFSQIREGSETVFSVYDSLEAGLICNLNRESQKLARELLTKLFDNLGGDYKEPEGGEQLKYNYEGLWDAISRYENLPELAKIDSLRKRLEMVKDLLKSSELVDFYFVCDEYIRTNNNELPELNMDIVETEIFIQAEKEKLLDGGDIREILISMPDESDDEPVLNLDDEFTMEQIVSIFFTEPTDKKLKKLRDKEQSSIKIITAQPSNDPLGLNRMVASFYTRESEGARNMAKFRNCKASYDSEGIELDYRCYSLHMGRHYKLSELAHDNKELLNLKIKSGRLLKNLELDESEIAMIAGCWSHDFSESGSSEIPSENSDSEEPESISRRRKHEVVKTP